MSKTQTIPAPAESTRPGRGRATLLAGSTLLLGFVLVVMWGAFGSSASAESESPRRSSFGTESDSAAPEVSEPTATRPADFGDTSEAAPEAAAPERNVVTETREPTAKPFALPVAAPTPSPINTVAAPVAVNQCNGTDNVGGMAVECDVTVTNNINLATGVTSSTMTIRECHGAANAVPTCTVTPLNSSDVVTSVDQCNGSGNGGGGTVTCRVDITNNITGAATTSPITVNQCNTAGTGGGTEPTILCNPFPATTSGATVTQCNTAGTGGGSTLRVRCSVDSASTETAAFPMTIEQCVGSGNGGGGFVTCTVRLRTIVTAAQVDPEPEPEPEPTPPDEPTPTEPTPGGPTPTEPGPTPTAPPTATPGTPGATPTPTPGSPSAGAPSAGAPSPGAPSGTPVAGAPGAPETEAAPVTGGPTADAPRLARGSASRSTTGRGSASSTATGTSDSGTDGGLADTGLDSSTLIFAGLMTLMFGFMLMLFSRFTPARARKD